MYTLDKAKTIAAQWAEPPFDEATRREVRTLLDQNDEEAILDRFGREMEFGTAGLRGIMGAGIYYMNEYTIARAARGLADCLHTHYPDAAKRGVVIGYDCRHHSETFARITASVIAATGIRTYLYTRLGPTPLVPFAVRRLHAKVGIMITSSHNPKAYNGFKVYWENGAQIIAPLDTQIAECIARAPEYHLIERLTMEQAIADGKINLLDDAAIGLYTDWAARTAAQRDARMVRVLYTPLHGTGYFCMHQAFEKAGFNDFHVVEAQRDPDPEFPTVSAPNPEKEDSLDMAREEAARIDADLIVASDGDTDRIGVAVRDSDGRYVTLTGNQIGTLMLYYLFDCLREKKALTGKEFAVASVVSSPMPAALCSFFGAEFHQTLTGFKWMGNVAEELVAQGKHFVLAYEEAFGVTFGDSRDKDAVISILLMSEAAAYCKQHGETLLHLMDRMYCDCGLYLEAAAEKNYEGAEGALQMDTIMKEIREHPPEAIQGSPVALMRDVLSGIEYKNGVACGRVDLPSQNLIYFVLEDRSWLAIRPSGTEPKIKAYLGVVQPTTSEGIAADRQTLSTKLAALREAAVNLLSPA